MSKRTDQEMNGGDSPEVTWGPKLFLGVLVALLGFFYWLLIYSGGASGHNG